ncbi:MAG: cupin domain-containing protein [Caulobacterales bacterium]
MSQPYEIKDIREIAAAPGLVVREFTFAPGEATPWHHHSQMADRRYGLTGVVTLEVRGGPPVEIGPGVVAETPAGVAHRLINLGACEARLLFVQYGGRYDFIES